MRSNQPRINSTACTGCGADTHTSHGVDGRCVKDSASQGAFWLCGSCLREVRRGELAIGGNEWLGAKLGGAKAERGE